MHRELLGEVAIHAAVRGAASILNNDCGPGRPATVGRIERVGSIRAEHSLVQGHRIVLDVVRLLNQDLLVPRRLSLRSILCFN